MPIFEILVSIEGWARIAVEAPDEETAEEVARNQELDERLDYEIESIEEIVTPSRLKCLTNVVRAAAESESH